MMDKPDPRAPLEDCPWLPARELFHRLGYDPQPPVVHDDFEMPGRLWEFIYALAGRRFYLQNTDHLDDRALYAWLHDQWLDEPVADLSPESDWTCRVSPAETDTQEETASESAEGTEADPNDDEETWSTPWTAEGTRPLAEPVCDRDRWLPEPPGSQSTGMEDDMAFLDPEDSADGDADPLGLEAVDAAIRASRGEEGSEDSPAGLMDEDWQRPAESLRRAGVHVLPPDELTDSALHAKLWELLHHLACRGYYVIHTDHLSDRELYCALWQEGLREEVLLPGRSRTVGWYQDLLASEDRDELWLRYYATDAERAEYARQEGRHSLPPREKPPHRRDWRLPKGPF